MKEDKIIKYAKRLVDITIKAHNKNLLGKEKMSTFIKKNMNEKLNDQEYDNVLHLYNRYLALKGFEIVNDINHFNIINYNSEEYFTYQDKLYDILNK